MFSAKRSNVVSGDFHQNVTSFTKTQGWHTKETNKHLAHGSFCSHMPWNARFVSLIFKVTKSYHWEESHIHYLSPCDSRDLVADTMDWEELKLLNSILISCFPSILLPPVTVIPTSPPLLWLPWESGTVKVGGASKWPVEFVICGGIKRYFFSLAPRFVVCLFVFCRASVTHTPTRARTCSQSSDTEKIPSVWGSDLFCVCNGKRG